MYKIKLTAKAKKELGKIKKLHQSAIGLALEEIKENPLVGKSLSRELTNRYSYRIGIYRIIYKVNKEDKIIHILAAGHRANIYN
ncbi:MAG: type II toxin-antitoxin system RelE/ParE family toxin [Patescibacteria group bacterium]|nr:type II toxin-antitoxin system RelE/ParE family toxin [Patescibacteria group bacterium]